MTKTKRNNESTHFADWTTQKLKREAKSYHELIYGPASCYGRSDLFNFDGIMRELDARGIQPINRLEF